jgi:Zierdtviridae exonuclease
MERVERVFLRTTERKTFANCRWQWNWSFNNRWEAHRQKPALVFGGLCHDALAGWYIPGRKRGTVPAKSFEKLYAEMAEAGGYEFDVLDDDGTKVDALELGISMMKEYVEHWGADDQINVISAELHFQVDVYDKHGHYMFTYVGSFDLAYEDLNSGQFGLIETKTAASINTRFLSMDEQAGSYWVFAPLILQDLGKIPKGQDIDFILYNFLRKAMPDTRPRNESGVRLNKPSKDVLLEQCAVRSLIVPKGATIATLSEILSNAGIDPLQFGEPSKSQPPPWFVRQKVYRDTIDRENLLYRARAQSYEMQMVKDGKLPLYKNPSASYPNQQCLGCEFGDVCEMHETGGQWEELARLTMGTWDPYEDHAGLISKDAPATGPKLGLVVVPKLKRKKPL